MARVRHRGPAKPRVDAVTFLTVYLVLLIALPSKLVVSAMGSAGSPAAIFGLLALLFWAVSRVARAEPTGQIRQPLRLPLLLFGGAVLISYVAATIRPIDAVELRAADRGILMMLSWLGIALLAMDGIPSRDRLDVLVRRLCLLGGLLAFLGLLQFITKQELVDHIQIPGLTVNGDVTALSNRTGLTRPAGTALHPIEFGVALTMILPFALHYALEDRSGGWVRRWFPVVAISLAVPVSISRSAVVGAVVGLAVLVPTWAAARRRLSYLVCGALVATLYVLVPGLLGVIGGLFTGISSDSSALSRTASYELAQEFISRAPVFGRGFFTFLPAYRILDNQYLGVVIELGLVGLAVLLALFVSAFFTARRARRLAIDTASRQLAQAMAAAVAAGAVSFAFFDAFSFPIVASLMFLTIGLIGALYQLTARSVPLDATTPGLVDITDGAGAC